MSRLVGAVKQLTPNPQGVVGHWKEHLSGGGPY